MTSEIPAEDRAREDRAAPEGGSFDVLRRRLQTAAAALEDRAQQLNAKRTELFGGTEMTVVGTERVRTEHNCVPRDIVAVGDTLVFAYNVFMGLKTETRVEDVFSLHRLEGEGTAAKLSALSLEHLPGFLAEDRFQKEFDELNRFYKDARLTRVSAQGGRLLAMFQTGRALSDVKGFRWGLRSDGTVSYIDNRADEDYRLPPSHGFEWKKTSREDQVRGRHPHVNILNTIFVETVGGDLTIKVEDNTEDGLGIYREPVNDPRQSLDDADIAYAKVGSLILLKILPYQEKQHRYLVFNTLSRNVKRIDALGLACVELPEDHGIVFPGGYYLESGETKAFDTDIEDLVFERSVASPNGEDVLYAFYHREQGRYLLLPYNLIKKEVSSPIECHGFTLFEDGRMLVFKTTSDDATRVHPIQIWQTPFFSEEHALSAPVGESYLERIGNAELVRGISDALAVARQARVDRASRREYEALVAACARMPDSYHWLGHDEALALSEPVETVRAATEGVIDELEKVVVLEERAAASLEQARAEQVSLLREIRPADWREVEAFMGGMTALQRQRGHLITLRDVRFIDLSALEALEAEVVQAFERVSARCVELLLGGDALKPTQEATNAILEQASEVQKATELEPLEDKVETLSEGLNLLSETVAGLEVDDPTDRTRILEDISEVFSGLNRCRAVLLQRKKALSSTESRAELIAQLRLLSQSIQSSVALSETPEACDDGQSRLLVQIEELEARFSDLDELLEELTQKREEVVDAFGAKRQQLVDARQRRAANLAKSAERILDSAERRASGFKEEDALNAWFAADPMLLKLRQLADQLVELGDTVEADDVIARLKASKQTALRNLRDKRDLFGDDQLITLGRHRFHVNEQPFDLALLPRGEGLALHVTGTEYWEPIEDPELNELSNYWERSLVSESPDVYRGEYLATAILEAAEQGQEGLLLDQLLAEAHDEGALLSVVRKVAAQRYEEGYERGIHDVDAAAILEKLLVLRSSAGPLRFPPGARALGQLWWAFEDDAELEASLERRAASLGRLRTAFASSRAEAALAETMAERLADFASHAELSLEGADPKVAATYLAEELMGGAGRFVLAAESRQLADELLEHLELEGKRKALEEDLETFANTPGEAFRLAEAWLDAYLSAKARARARREAELGSGASAPASAAAEIADEEPPDPDAPLWVVRAEAAAHLVLGTRLDREVSSALTHARVEGLLGTHPRIRGGGLELRIDELGARLERFRSVDVPAFRRLRTVKQRVLEEGRARLRLEELRPRVLTSFVRNRLIDEVYLPMIGDNLAKQLGSAGDQKRTDLMGMLLLVSPPGYGKTTLMEYVASRLGMVFMKVNGPSLGHSVISLDPSEAPNATARQEVEKINLAFEMANNVMLYLDDIQHTHPELLQKFISLCDGQRRIEGVWRGKTQTYDLRGKKLCVIMAGNPYTESGDKFQIPDMLANRADTYNLGEILDGREEVFALSYVENALTSSPILGPMASRSLPDVHRLIERARGREVPDADFEQDWSRIELEEGSATLKRLFAARDVLLSVNQQYIVSASQDDRFRTEPPFKLQGSYRNMNKLAEKIVPAMNDAELEALVTNHYLGESQTLTTGAEANLLKLAELRGLMTEEEASRWASIKKEIARLRMAGGDDSDPATRIASVLSALAERVEGIKDALAAPKDGPDTGLAEALGRLEQALEKVAQPKLAVTLNDDRADIAATLKPFTAALAPLASTAAATAEDGQRLLPALAELVEVLRMQALAAGLDSD